MRQLTHDSEFLLDNQPIGDYLEVQALDEKTVRILHSREHNPSHGEIVKWFNALSPFRVHRLTVVKSLLIDLQFYVVRDRPQWEPNVEV